ncbi:unnamed protein product [Arctogadus glacialis]
MYFHLARCLYPSQWYPTLRRSISVVPATGPPPETCDSSTKQNPEPGSHSIIASPAAGLLLRGAGDPLSDVARWPTF